jgi:hypothetical protein
MAEYYLTTKKRRAVKAQEALSRTDDPSSQYKTRKATCSVSYISLFLCLTADSRTDIPSSHHREFYQHLQPFAGPFMALFERDRLPSHSALSRFLAAVTEVPIEALRTLFLDDLLSRPLSNASQEKQTGGLEDPRRH